VSLRSDSAISRNLYFPRTFLGRVFLELALGFSVIESSHYLAQPTPFFLHFCTTSVPSQLPTSSSSPSTRYHIRVTTLLGCSITAAVFYPSCLQSPISQVYPEECCRILLQAHHLEQNFSATSNWRILFYGETLWKGLFKATQTMQSSSTTRPMELTDTALNRDAYQLKLIQEPIEGRAAGRTEKGE